MVFTASFSKPGRAFLLAVVGLLLLWLPCLLRGPDSYVLIDDNLDAELNLPYLLHRFEVALDYRPGAELPPVMNGLPRNAVRPGLSLTVGLFGLLEPLWAYWLNQLLVRLVALAGMYLLLRRYVLSQQEHRPLAAAVALCWATLPAYTMYGLSGLGGPWPLLAVLNLRHRRGSWTDWLVLAAFPFWSSFVLGGFFIVVGLGVWLLMDAARTRRMVLPAWGGVVVLGLSYAVVEWPLLRSVLLAPQFVPHRVEFQLVELAPKGLVAGLRSSLQYFAWGQYHSSRFFRGGVGLTLLLAAWQLRRAAEPWGAWRRGVITGLLVLLGLALFCGFYPQLMGHVQRLVPALGAFNLTRFHFLTGLIWFGLWAVALQQLPAGRLRAALVGLQLLIGLAANTEWVQNMRLWAGLPQAHEPTWRQYVAPQLLGQVRQALEQRSGQPASAWRVVSLGLPPAVAQLNGFYTLDSYQNNYPLSYKHRFRPLIAGELAKSPELRRYFDLWGNRCYVFSAELGRNFRVGKADSAVVQNFSFDTQTFRAMGGRYLLSAARLDRPGATGLRLIGRFDSSSAYWRLYIYEMID